MISDGDLRRLPRAGRRPAAADGRRLHEARAEDDLRRRARAGGAPPHGGACASLPSSCSTTPAGRPASSTSTTSGASSSSERMDAIAPNRSWGPELDRKARALRFLLLDVDGVLTDGRLHVGVEGEVFKSFHVRDGLAVKLAQAAGLSVGILSARSSEIVARRAAEIGIEEIVQGEEDKGAAFAQAPLPTRPRRRRRRLRRRRPPGSRDAASRRSLGRAGRRGRGRPRRGRLRDRRPRRRRLRARARRTPARGARRLAGRPRPLRPAP